MVSHGESQEQMTAGPSQTTADDFQVVRDSFSSKTAPGTSEGEMQHLEPSNDSGTGERRKRRVARPGAGEAGGAASGVVVAEWPDLEDGTESRETSGPATRLWERSNAEVSKG